MLKVGTEVELLREEGRSGVELMRVSERKESGKEKQLKWDQWK